MENMPRGDNELESQNHQWKEIVDVDPNEVCSKVYEP